jgi:hypothetical protein
MATEIVVTRGATTSFTFTIMLDGVAVDLTGQSLVFSVAMKAGIPPVITKQNTAAGGGDDEIELLAQTGATLGQCRVKFVELDTSTLTPGLYECDMWLVTQLGEEVQVVPVTPFRIGRAVTLEH